MSSNIVFKFQLIRSNFAFVIVNKHRLTMALIKHCQFHYTKTAIFSIFLLTCIYIILLWGLQVSICESKLWIINKKKIMNIITTCTNNKTKLLTK